MNKLKALAFDTGRIIKSIHHISEVSNIVTAIYHSTKLRDESSISVLETDGLGFVFTDPAGNSNVTASAVSDWIFRKAFEDFIVGLSQSLIEILVEVTKEFKKQRTQVDGMEARNIQRSLTFDAGSKIIMTPDIFKGVTYTCILFIREIVWHLPLDDAIKRNLAPPFEFTIATATDI